MSNSEWNRRVLLVKSLALLLVLIALSIAMFWLAPDRSTRRAIVFAIPILVGIVFVGQVLLLNRKERRRDAEMARLGIDEPDLTRDKLIELGGTPRDWFVASLVLALLLAFLVAKFWFKLL